MSNIVVIGNRGLVGWYTPQYTPARRAIKDAEVPPTESHRVSNLDSPLDETRIWPTTEETMVPRSIDDLDRLDPAAYIFSGTRANTVAVPKNIAPNETANMN